MSEVSVDVKADTNSSVNAPVFTGNTITGPVTIICGSNTAEQQNSTEKRTQEQETLGLKEFLRSHKIYMKENSKRIFEGMKENEADLNEIYTDVFITEGDMKEVNCEREILKIDDAFKNTTKTSQDKHIKCNEIFQSLRDKKKIILTKGVAGIGKTVSVQKFILDWAEGTANQDIDAMFLFPFREMNQIEDKVSFHEFLLEFYPEMKINVIKVTEKCNVAFIFDGLDESRLSLNFKSRKRRSVEERSSVDEMIINLIRGDLLPSSLIWITSRPAAANQIPSKFVGLFTEVRGFTDRQKEEYFRKRIKDKSQADEMIKHIKRSRSLYIMCHIPVFCWITASVLHDILIQNHEENIDTTLTEMYIHYLLIQMNMKNQKYDEEDEEDYTKLLESNKTTILKLAKLAFEQLKKENIIFYEEDLKDCDIDVSKDSEYTGMIAEIFKKESVLHKTKVFSFIHLSVQEFLAALHVFICYMTINMKDLEFFITPKQDTKISLHDILENAIDKSTESERGHLDLFLRFLMGLSLESSQKLLKGLLTRTEDTRDSITKTTRYIQRLQDDDDEDDDDDDVISDEASVNLFYCLLELKDQSLYERIQKYLHPDDSDSVTNLSDSMCTLMIYVLLMSENVLDEFNMNRYKTRYKQRLVPAVRCCRRAILSGCDLTAESCEVVSSALQFSKCPLRELDLSNNDLKDSGVKLISEALKTHNCQLHTLRLSGCNVTEECCVSLSSCLQSSTSLRELDLSNNDLKDSGVKLISDALKTHNCQLHTLRLSLCNVTEECCVSLSSCLQSSTSLRELDLSNNDLKDSGVKLISDALKTHNCQLHTLRLSGCMVTDEGCCSLASALSSQSSHLRELDLSYNHPQHTKLQLLSHTLNDPNYTINVSHGGERRVRAGLHKCVFGDIVSVNEGESVTLHTHLTELQTDDLIVWYFMGVHIARINREVNRDPVYDPDVRFTDRLKMNNQTGDLTITNITSELTGLYQLDITSKESKTETFSVSLSLKVKMVKERDSVSLHIDVTEEQRDEKIHWKIKHNNSLVAEIITENRKISTSFIEERFRDRLKLDDQTGDLIITHMKNEDSGQYEADVTIGHTHTIHKTFSFTDSAGGLSSGAIAGICVGVLLVIAAAVAVVFYRRRRLSRSRMV